jgi:putative acetyltransferase
MSIRAFSDNDYPRVLDIYANSKLDELRFEPVEFELLPLDQDEKRLSALNESALYVYDDGQVLGYGAIFGTEIRALFVCPNARGKGVGKTILEFLLSKIRGRANLFVAKSNIPAKALYKQYGFEVSNEFITDYNGQSVYANEMLRSNGKR